MPGSLFDYSVAGFGGLFCLTWAMSLAIPGRNAGSFIAVAFVGMSGLRLIWEAFFLSGLFVPSPFYYVLFLPIMYAIGPVIMAYYDRLAGLQWKRFEYLHFLFPVFAALPLFWVSSEPEALIALILEIFESKRSAEGWFLVLWVIGPKALILAYSLWIPLRSSGEGARALQSLPSEIKPFAHILLLYVWLMILADIAGYLFSITWLFRASVWSHTLAAIAVFFFSRVQPSAMFEFSEAIQKVRYAKSKLSGLDVEGILEKLNRLMGEESYYADEDLRLAGLADAVDLTPHQLSELINSHLDMSFAEFVNQHRVEAACNMLLEQKDRSILSVALAVGFNSKSSFNRAFKGIAGVTPGQYRQRENRSV